MTDVSEEHAGKAETFRNRCDSNSQSKPSVPKKLDPQSLDFPLAAQDSECKSFLIFVIYVLNWFI